jgi:VWFA-related protein
MPVNVRVAGWWGATGAVVALATTIAVAQTPPAFQARVDVVVVEATVLDRDGAVVTGLEPADFAVEIEGSRRDVLTADFVRHDDAGAESTAANPDITTNTAAAAGRTIVIAVDYVSLRAQSRDVLQTAKAWVGTLGPTDRVGLMALPQPGVNIELTTDHARVMQALDGIVAHPNPPPPFSNRNISPWEAVRIWEGDAFVWAEVLERECKGVDPSCPDEIKFQVKSLQQDTESTVIPVVRALRSLAQGLRALPGPKHVVLLTSGWLMSEREAALEMATVAGAAALANVTVHTFTTEQWAMAASRSKPNMTPMQDAMLLMSSVETLSGMTGGRAVRLTGNADLAFASLSAGLGGYYRLGIRAQSEDLDGTPRKISTKVLRSGLTLANSRRILAATTSPAARAPAGGDPQAALRAALESPTPELGLDVRATAYVLHGAGGSRDVRVVTVGDIDRAAAGRATAVAR